MSFSSADSDCICAELLIRDWLKIKLLLGKSKPKPVLKWKLAFVTRLDWTGPIRGGVIKMIYKRVIVHCLAAKPSMKAD